MFKKHKLLFYFFSFAFLITFSFILSNFAFAAELNVDYPALSTGANITSQTLVPAYFKYVFDFAMFVGFFAVFLSLVFAGVLYLLSPAVPSAIVMARDRVSGAISGLIILTTIYLIVTTINPALSVFKTTDLKALPPPSSGPPPQAGVYLYNETGCPVLSSGRWDYSFFSTISAPNLGSPAKQIKSAKIVQNETSSIYYIGILYENPKFWGKCKYINPNISCEPNIEPFASSVSVYEYNHKPRAGSITFYRKPFFDPSGGSYQISGSATKGIYKIKLKELIFNNVPEEEQVCIKWDIRGACMEKKPQDLSEKNIASIKIDGDYLVVLVYFDKEKPDPEYGPWTSCQSFGTFGDEDKEGPREIKWENIRNLNSGNLPNYMFIIPIKNKKISGA